MYIHGRNSVTVTAVPSVTVYLGVPLQCAKTAR